MSAGVKGSAVPGHRPGTLYPTGTARALFVGVGTAEFAGAAAGFGARDTLPRPLWDRLRAHDVRPETLLAAWEVSGWPDGATEASGPESLQNRRALAALAVALGEAVDAGSTYLDLGGHALGARLPRLGFDASETSAAAALAARLVTGDIPPSMRALFGAPGQRRPFAIAGQALYPEALWTLEQQLASMLSSRLAARQASSPIPDAELVGLGPEQGAAVQAALALPLTLITGGPGTGKTSTIVALLRALFRAGVSTTDVAVAAPTGRAAQRITESLQAARLDDGGGQAPLGASTVHRLLGLRPARRPTLEAEAPEYHAGWRLPQRFVIVDEASMIDLYVMTQLAAAVRDNARLILVGDADQLPSVRLGAVFRDLCAALPGQTRHLTTSYRMDPADAAGAAILRVAQAVLADRPPPLTRHRRVSELGWSGVEQLPNQALPELLSRWSEDVLGGSALLDSLGACRFAPDQDGRLGNDAPLGPLGEVLQRHARARLLCITRSADDQTSADALNALLHAHFVRHRRSSSARNGDAPGVDLGLLPGEPVTILRNDYQRGLWNGDQGVVVAQAAGAGDPLGVAFSRGDGTVVHGLGELGDNVGLGYALTVHKAQGSEYDRVALVLPTSDGPLLTREILYTALTRARRSVVIVGDVDLFATACRRKLERASGLDAKLDAALAASAGSPVMRST